MPYRTTEVFTPNDFPRHSYVPRDSERMETRLRDALEVPKSVISLSGPSKAGKTVLMERVVGEELLIKVSGIQIEKAADLWERVLDWMGVPQSTTHTDTTTLTGQAGVTAAGKAGVPLLVEATAGGSAQLAASQAGADAKAYTRTGLAQVEREIAKSGYVVFLDDFHYIPKAVQTDVAKQVKAAAELGIRVCLAAVPHRADDAVRSNSELRGRAFAVDVGLWKAEELAQIATTGFQALGYRISDADAARFAHESCRSPQLMQQICLQAARVKGIRVGRDDDAVLNLSTLGFTESEIREALEEAALQTDYTSLVRDMHLGPKTRGVERKVFKFTDGSSGDVYRATLLAISRDPPASELSYADLQARILSVCDGDSPGMGSVSGSISQIAQIVRGAHPDERILEWDTDAAGGTLSIADPYLPFYLRSSSKLAELGGVRP